MTAALASSPSSGRSPGDVDSDNDNDNDDDSEVFSDGGDVHHHLGVPQAWTFPQLGLLFHRHWGGAGR